MTITSLRTMTRDQLLKAPLKLREVTFNSDKTQVNLRDGIFTVASLRRLAGLDQQSWGA